MTIDRVRVEIFLALLIVCAIDLVSQVPLLMNLKLCRFSTVLMQPNTFQLDYTYCGVGDNKSS
jgi:hypothetical protein